MAHVSVRTEVRPLVSSMPTKGFTIQTGGSARRKVVKNENGTFQVSGVPGHSHNASGVLSVLCDLSRTRGTALNIGDPWAYGAIALGAADRGDSDDIDNADARYDRAIERGIGEIAIIPENCHQEIREPARSISEVRKLVTAQDRRSTLTYVEEVGGFVNATTGHPFISDYPDVYVDILHDRGDLTLAPRTNAGTFTGYKTPFVLQTDDYERDDVGGGEGDVFLVLLLDSDYRPTHSAWDPVVTLQAPSGELIVGQSPFEWVELAINEPGIYVVTVSSESALKTGDYVLIVAK